jgi:hypothetical protein
MAILSSLTLIRTLSLAHLVAAYYFLVAPRVVADNNIIFMLGESMQMVGLKIYLAFLRKKIYHLHVLDSNIQHRSMNPPMQVLLSPSSSPSSV